MYAEISQIRLDLKKTKQTKLNCSQACNENKPLVHTVKDWTVLKCSQAVRFMARPTVCHGSNKHGYDQQQQPHSDMVFLNLWHCQNFSGLSLVAVFWQWPSFNLCHSLMSDRCFWSTTTFGDLSCGTVYSTLISDKGFEWKEKQADRR